MTDSGAWRWPAAPGNQGACATGRPSWTVTTSPASRPGSVVCSYVRVVPSLNVTVVDQTVSFFTFFSIALPATPPPTAPSTVATVLPDPLPIWCATRPPSAGPPTAPARLPLRESVSTRVSETTPQAAQIEASLTPRTSVGRVAGG